MTYQTLILFMALTVIVMIWWAHASKRDKIYCTFIRANKTSVRKFVKMSSQYVVFGGTRRNIIPSCIVWEFWDKGLIHALFPQTVATLTFSYSNPYPIDPNTLQPIILSAEVRKLMNKEEMWRDYNKTLIPNLAKKQLGFQQWLPWVALVTVGLLAFYVVMSNQAIAKDLANLANQLRAIAK